MVKTDKRKRLTDEQKVDIQKLFDTTKLGDRKIAEQFGVSRRTIQFMRNPDRKSVV